MKRRRPSPAMAVALAALFVALGGSAFAVSKIGSGDIAKDAVRSKHIKDGQVKARDADLTKARTASGIETVTNPADLELDELDITVNAKRGDVLAIQAYATGRRISGGSNCSFVLELAEAGGGSEALVVLQLNDLSPERRFVDETVAGTPTSLLAQGRDFPVWEAGAYEFHAVLRPGSSTACEIDDRGLAITTER